MKNLSFCDLNRRQIHLISDKVWTNNVIFIWTGFNCIFFLNYSLICFQYIHFTVEFKCVYVWGFYETSDCWWLTVFQGKNHCQTVFDPLTSHADVLRLVTATKQVLAFFFCQENIKVNLSECTSLFQKWGLVFCQRAKEACRFLRASFFDLHAGKYRSIKPDMK